MYGLIYLCVIGIAYVVVAIIDMVTIKRTDSKIVIYFNPRIHTFCEVSIGCLYLAVDMYHSVVAVHAQPFY